LIEMMVVIAVISIVSAFAVPAVNGWLPDYRVKRAARELYGNLQRAKMRAVKDNAGYNINFLQGPDRYEIKLTGAAEDDPAARTISLAGYGSGTHFGRPDNGGSEAIPESGNIQFNQFGMCMDNLGNPVVGFVYLANAQGTVHYRVGPTLAGAVLMERYNRLNKQWN